MAPCEQAERAVSRFEEAGGVLGDLGMALIRLAKFEGEQGVASATYSASAPDCRSLAADCQRTGKARPHESPSAVPAMLLQLVVWTDSSAC